MLVVKWTKLEGSVQNHAKQIKGMYERLQSLARYSREYNLRFYNVAESPGEDCLQKIQDILSNQLDMEAKIENAHRVGPAQSDEKPRCKIEYLPTILWPYCR